MEIQGLQVRVNANLDYQSGGGNPKSTPSKRNRSERPSQSVRTDRARTTQYHVHDPGGGFSEALPYIDVYGRTGVAEHLPTTIDMAKSFLHDESKEEKDHLQEAIAKSQCLDESLIISDDDELSGLGVANTLSLPRFLADFLKGVTDRVQVDVKDVEVDLDMKVDVTSENSVNSDTSERSNSLTLRIYVEHLFINAITRLEAHRIREQESVQEESTSVPNGIRRVKLTELKIMLISDASLFANVARSTETSSPEITHAIIAVGSSSNKSTQSPPPYTIARPKTTNTSLSASLDGQDSPDSEASTISHFSQRPNSSEGTYPEKKASCTMSISTAGDSELTGSFYSTNDDNARSLEQGKGHRKLPGKSPHGEAANYRSSDLLSRSCHNSVRAASLESNRTHRATVHASPPQSFAAGNSQSELENTRNQDLLRSTQLPVKPRDPGDPVIASVEALPSRSSSPGSHTTSPKSDDLAQSKIFSHEEAESMYMSAISHISAPRTDKVSSVPGQWGTSSSYSSDEGRGPLVVGDNASPQDRRTSIPREVEISATRNGFESRHGKSAGRTLQVSRIESSENTFPPSRLPPYRRNEPVSPVRLPGQGNSSSQGSEASSANLKSPFTTMRHILSIDFIVMEVSQDDPGTTNIPNELKYHAPAALSQTLPRSSKLSSQTKSADSPGISVPHHNSESHQSDRWPSVSIGNVQILSDMGLVKLMILVLERLNALRPVSVPGKSRTAAPQTLPKKISEVRLKVKRMYWKFVDVVKGVPVSDVRPLPKPVEKFNLCGDSEVLLRAEMEDLCAVYHMKGTTSVLEVLTRKFSFGYVSDDILSFDPGLKMRESVRDVLAPLDNDMKLMVTQTVSATKVELTTLPLHIALDACRLDETFAWFGGLSSMLGLGSSMVSTMTVVEVAAKSSDSSRLARGVRFEGHEQDNPKLSSSTQTQNKITARVGGLVVDLQGTRSSLRLESTAMKLVSRTEGLGLQVDRLNITGPYLQNASREPSTAVKLSNFRIEYLSMPKEKDLDRLLALLSPSKDEYERDDDILLDTLLRQRRQGGVVRATVESLEGVLSDLDDLQCLAVLFEDLKKLSTVTKYLPEDDRPGILTLILVRHLRLKIQVNHSFGSATLVLKDLEAAQVAFPSLVALGITNVNLHRNGGEELVGSALPMDIVDETYSPMVMARFIGNEMEPTAKIKFYNVRFEYHVPTLMAIMGIEDNTSAESIVAGMVSSVATLTTRATEKEGAPKPSSQGAAGSDLSQGSKGLKLDISLRDSTLGLNPRGYQSKGLVVLTDTHFVGAMPRGEEAEAVLDIRKASLMVIDNHDNVSFTPQSSGGRRNLVELLSNLGYVSVSLISAAKATINVVKAENHSRRAIDIEIRDDLFVLESCADSTQTLQNILAGLKPPMPRCTELKYRTEVIPVEDMLASFSGDSFPASQVSHSTDEDLPLGLDEGDMVDDEVPQDHELASSFYNPSLESVYEDSMLEDDTESLPNSSIAQEAGRKDRLESFEEQTRDASDDEPLRFKDDHFGTNSVIGGTVYPQNTLFDSGFNIVGSPLRVRVRDVHFIWNLYDGYDWKSTRDTISQTIERVQYKAMERMTRKDKRKSADLDEDEESVIGDFLFNSIYIGISSNRDPRELAHQVNRNLDDHVSETESYATSTASSSPSRKGQVSRSRGNRKLRLNRSKYHKMTFELKGVSADVTVFPPDSGDTQSSLDIRIRDLEIFDHVPTSTWKKFATYMHEAGERESGTDMIHLELLNVKPVPNLAASEIILKVRKEDLENTKANSSPGHHTSLATPCRSGCPGFHDSFLRIQG